MGIPQVAVKLAIKTAEELAPAAKRVFPVAREAVGKFIKGIGKEAPKSAAPKIEADDAAALKQARELIKDKGFKEVGHKEAVKTSEKLRPINLGLLINDLSDIVPGKIYRLAAKESLKNGGLERLIDIKFEASAIGKMMQTRIQTPNGYLEEAKFITRLRDFSEGKSILNIDQNNTITINLGQHSLTAKREGQNFIFR